eukprot:3043503-Amphidinium_carterae.1
MHPCKCPSANHVHTLSHGCQKCIRVCGCTSQHHRIFFQAGSRHRAYKDTQTKTLNNHLLHKLILHTFIGLLHREYSRVLSPDYSWQVSISDDHWVGRGSLKSLRWGVDQHSGPCH